VETIVVHSDHAAIPFTSGRTCSPSRTLYRRHGEAGLIVTNEVVAPLYLNAVQAALRGRALETVILPDGERHKTLATFTTVIDRLIDARFHRDCCLVALGGGVVGD
jgi:3-dehydroquinate synthase